RRSPLTVAGAAAALRETSQPAFPFHPPRPDWGRGRDRHAPPSKQATPTLVNRSIAGCAALPLRVSASHLPQVSAAHRPSTSVSTSMSAALAVPLRTRRRLHPR